VFVEIICIGIVELDVDVEVVELISVDVEVVDVVDVVTLNEVIEDLVVRATGPKTSMVIGLLKEASLPVSG